MERLSLLYVIVCLLMSGSSSMVASASTPQIWFGGEDPVTLKDKHRNEPADFMGMFQPASPWRQASSKVAAFKISMQFASRSSDAELTTVITDLHRRGISLAIEMGMLRNDRGCGKGEGYMPKGLLNLVMRRIQRLGGRLDYVAMDEIVFFGREKSWPDQPGLAPCRDTVEELVHEVAENVALIHQYFPQARIGMVEPITTTHNLDLSQLVKDYFAFADLYRTETGSSLAFMHADIAWRSKNWQPGIGPLKAGLQARGIPFGIIIGGNPDYTEDVSWANAGLNQLKILADSPVTSPEAVIIQSWQPLPTHYLPETTPGTSTWMLLQAETLLHL